ncbi:MAG: FliH/SctL family protein [Planctomycetota bacterium]
MSELLKIRLPKVLRRVHVPGSRGAKARSAVGGMAPSMEGEMDRLLEEAYQDGYGRATKEWGARLTEVLRSLDREAGKLNACRQEFISSLERNVVDLGVAVAEKFVLSERDKRNYSIEAIVKSVLQKLELKGGRLTVALNPSDYEAMDREVKLDDEGIYESIRVVAEPEVPRAGCRLDTGLGRVAFSLEEQMEEIRQLLARTEVLDESGQDDEIESSEADAQPVRAH